MTKAFFGACPVFKDNRSIDISYIEDKSLDNTTTYHKLKYKRCENCTNSTCTIFDNAPEKF